MRKNHKFCFMKKKKRKAKMRRKKRKSSSWRKPSMSKEFPALCEKGSTSCVYSEGEQREGCMKAKQQGSKSCDVSLLHPWETSVGGGKPAWWTVLSLLIQLYRKVHSMSDQRHYSSILNPSILEQLFLRILLFYYSSVIRVKLWTRMTFCLSLLFSLYTVKFVKC